MKNLTVFVMLLATLIGCAENGNLVYKDIVSNGNVAGCGSANEHKKISLTFITGTSFDVGFPLQPLAMNIHQDFQNAGLTTLNSDGSTLYQAKSKQEFESYLEGKDYAIVFFVKGNGDSNYFLDFYLHGVKKNKPLLAFKIPLTSGQAEFAAHKVSDIVYQCLTGSKGPFSSQVLSFEKGENGNLLNVSLYNGSHKQKILLNRNSIYYAQFLPDRKRIIYVSDEENVLTIVLQEIFTAKRYLVKELQSLPTRLEIDDDGQRLVYDNPDNNSILLYDMMSGREDVVELKTLEPFSPSWGNVAGTIYFLSKKEGAPGIYKYDTNKKETSHVSDMENIDSYIFSANENNLYLLTRATASTHELIEYDIKTQKQRSIDSGNIASLGLSPGDQFLYYTKTGADGKSTVVRSLIFEGGYQIPGVSVVYW